MIHHIKALIDRRRKELTIETAALPKGEKIRPLTDLLGAMVASNLEHESGMTGQGLSAEELVGNVCESSCMACDPVPKEHDSANIADYQGS